MTYSPIRHAAGFSGTESGIRDHVKQMFLSTAPSGNTSDTVTASQDAAQPVTVREDVQNFISDAKANGKTLQQALDSVDSLKDSAGNPMANAENLKAQITAGWGEEADAVARPSVQAAPPAETPEVSTEAPVEQPKSIKEQADAKLSGIKDSTATDTTTAPAAAPEKPSWYAPAKGLAQGLRDYGLTLLTTGDEGKAWATGIQSAFGPLDKQRAAMAKQAEIDKQVGKLAEGRKYTSESLSVYQKTHDPASLVPVEDTRIAIARAESQAKAGKATQESKEAVTGIDDTIAGLTEVNDKLQSGYYDTGPIEGSDFGMWLGQVFGTEDSDNLREMQAKMFTSVESIMNQRKGTQTDRDELRALRQQYSTSNTVQANMKIIRQMIDRLQSVKQHELEKQGKVETKTTQSSGNFDHLWAS